VFAPCGPMQPQYKRIDAQGAEGNGFRINGGEYAPASGSRPPPTSISIFRVVIVPALLAIGIISLIVYLVSQSGQQDIAGFSPVPFGCKTNASCSGHDPTGLQLVKDSEGAAYVTFVTGSGNGEALGVRYIRSGDDTWQKGPDSYLKPQWVVEMFPTERLGCGKDSGKACSLWAPDLPSNGNGLKPYGNDFVVYYSVSDFADADDGIYCIGRATGSWPDIDLKDSGSPVICHNKTLADLGAPHTLDPSVVVDHNGRWWLTYGSWSNYGHGKHQGARGGGVWMVELDSTTGMLGKEAADLCGEDFPFCWDKEAYTKKTQSPWTNIANHRGYHSPEGYVDGNSIEASYLYNNMARTGHYYLFVNWYWCCRGAQSTYQIRVGRSKTVTGPFMDENGVDMKDNGGLLLLNTTKITHRHTFIGPGHAGILYEESRERYIYTTSYESLDDKDQQLDVFLLRFKNGWPHISGNFKTLEEDRYFDG